MARCCHTATSERGHGRERNIKRLHFGRFLLRPPKLVHVKYASRLQTVSQLYQGWRGVSTQRHRSDGAAGKAAYHKQYCSSRAEHQALAVWKFLGRTPYTHHRTSAPFQCTTRAFGAHLTRAYKVPFRGMFRLHFVPLNMT